MNIKETMIEMLSERYGWSKEQIESAESFDELGLDSLSLYSLVTDCEEKFAVKIDTDDMTQIDSPEKFIKYLTEKLNNDS